MNITIGWIFLLGGAAGAATSFFAKTRSDLHFGVDKDGNDSAIQPKLRLHALIINIILMIGGAITVNAHHNWNPFTPCTNCKSDGGAVS